MVASVLLQARLQAVLPFAMAKSIYRVLSLLPEEKTAAVIRL
jgi:hypothetical protein